MPCPGTNVTSALTSSLSGGVPAWFRTCESAIEKHEACAAAISSSGLVMPFSSPVRAGHETSSGPIEPLPTFSIAPDPLSRSPFHVTFARLSTMASSFCVLATVPASTPIGTGFAWVRAALVGTGEPEAQPARERSRHAPGSLERQARTPVGAHQAGPEGARPRRGYRRGDRGPDREQGAGTLGRGRGG